MTNLQNFIELVLERFRSAQFNIKDFKTLTHASDMRRYADATLTKVGEGSSRQVFILSSRQVLKIALNKPGVAQNMQEVEVYTNPQSKPIVTKIYDYDPNFKWLISEIVRPIKNSKEFLEIFNIPLFGDGYHYTFMDFMSNAYHNEYMDEYPIEARQFAAAMRMTAKNNDLILGDLADPGHWGKTQDGRIVLLDSGASVEIINKYYGSSQEKTPGTSA